MYFTEDRDIRKDINLYKDSLKDSPPKSRLAKLSCVFRFFEDNGHTFSRNFIKNLKGKGKDAVSDEHIPTAEEIGRIVEYLPIQEKTLTLVLVSSGMRVDEALQLILDNIDLDNNPVKITLPAAITKTKKKRIIFITPEAEDQLTEWINYRHKFIVQSNKRAQGIRNRTVSLDDDRIFPFTYENFLHLWHGALEKSDLYDKDSVTGRVKLRPHNLRKSFSTYGVWTNEDIPDALQGHARGMRAIYNRYDKAEEVLEEAYLEAQDNLSIYGHSKNVIELQKKVDRQSEDIQKLITNLSVKNIRLNEKVESLTEDMMNLGEQFGRMEGLEEKIEELEIYINVDELKEAAEYIKERKY